MGMLLELNQETLEYIENLKSDLKKLSEDMAADKKEIQASFNNHSEGLGVHTEDFEDWVNGAVSSVKDNGENVLDDVISSLTALHTKISEYISF